MEIRASVETSWRITSIGKSGARSSGPTGLPVPGCRTGAGGSGRSAATLYQASGRRLSSRVYFTVSPTTAPLARPRARARSRSCRIRSCCREARILAQRDQVLVRLRVLGERGLELDRAREVLERDVRPPRAGVRAGEVVVGPGVVRRVDETPFEDLDRLVPLLRRPEAQRLGGALPRRRRERLSALGADGEDRRAGRADRAPLHRRIGDVHDRPGGRRHRLAVERERRLAREDDVDLLVAL